MGEIWKDIEGYNGLYQVSSEGKVKSLKCGKERLLKTMENHNGYLIVGLRKDGKTTTHYVHRLVADAFLPNPENRPQVDHINTIRTDCNVLNLRWVTNKENHNNPISKENHTKNNSRSNYDNYVNAVSKPVIQFTKDGWLIREWKSLKEAERELGIKYQSISACCKGKTKTSGGYKWQFS